MKISTFQGECIPVAISLFQNKFEDLRANAPAVPDEMGKPTKIRDLLVGFIQFERDNEDSAIVVQSKDTIAITGAYLRPAYRGLGLASAVLDAALRDYASQGYARCSVDFESFNPEASRFWMKYFDAVCLSVMRVPERVEV